MGAYHDKLFTDCGQDVFAAMDDAPTVSDVMEDVVMPGGSGHRRLQHRCSFFHSRINHSGSDADEEDICIGGLKRVVEVDEESKDERLDAYEEKPVIESRYAFEKSKLARTRTIAVCQRRHDPPQLWAWQRDGKKPSSDDNVIIGKVTCSLNGSSLVCICVLTKIMNNGIMLSTISSSSCPDFCRNVRLHL